MLRRKLLLTLVTVALALPLVFCTIIPTPTPETVYVEQTVEVEVTREVLVTPTPTVTPIRTVLFQDDLTVDDGNWDLNDTENTERSIANGQYIMEIKTAGITAWGGHSSLESLGDFILDVDLTKLDGPDNNEFGIMFRYISGDNHYRLALGSDGYFRIYGKEEDEFFYIISWVPIPEVNQGNTTNHLRLVAEGNQFTVYLNGEMVAKVLDRRFESGAIAPYARAYDDPGVLIGFDNFMVTTP